MTQQEHADFAKTIVELVDREGKKLSSTIIEILKDQAEKSSLDEFLSFLANTENLDYIIESLQKNLVKIFYHITDISLEFAKLKYE